MGRKVKEVDMERTHSTVGRRPINRYLTLWAPQTSITMMESMGTMQRST
jgi:hypothetical protein